jgi:pimeloyl-ACP methyl ester carboxylesterase
MLVGFMIGLINGFLMRRGRAIFFAVLVYIGAVEIGRLDVVGPTVDAIRFDNTFSILALILGRGFHGLVGLLPMIPGLALGAAGANYLAGDRAVKRAGKVGRFVWGSLTAVLSLLLIALAVLIALPGSTPPIVDAAGNPILGSIAELVYIPIGGQEQGIMIRSYNEDNPVLLYLSGGPGQSSLPWPRVLFQELTQDFVLVGWDQRGTGKSYAALDPASALTPEQMVADTIEVTNYLRQRFDEEKIYLLGESWGTTLAVLAAQERPDLYHAIIGSGQMVSQRETDRRLYYDVVDYAARTGNAELAAEMEAYGEPPYEDVYAYAFVMGYYEALTKSYTPPAAYIERGTNARLGPWNVLGSEYNLVEKVNVFRGFLDTASVLYPQLQDIDFRRDVPQLETAVYIFDGAAELEARRALALEWYEMLEAPIKRIYTYENAGHAPAFEQFEAFQQIMTETVLPETYSE